MMRSVSLSAEGKIKRKKINPKHTARCNINTLGAYPLSLPATAQIPLELRIT